MGLIKWATLSPQLTLPNLTGDLYCLTGRLVIADTVRPCVLAGLWLPASSLWQSWKLLTVVGSPAPRPFQYVKSIVTAYLDCLNSSRVLIGCPVGVPVPLMACICCILLYVSQCLLSIQKWKFFIILWAFSPRFVTCR